MMSRRTVAWSVVPIVLLASLGVGYWWHQRGGDLSKALAAKERKDWDGAIVLLTSEIQLHPQNARAWHERGLCYFERAIEQGRKVGELAEKGTSELKEGRRVLRQKSDPSKPLSERNDEAFERIGSALDRLARGDSISSEMRHYWELARAESEKACADFTQAIAIDPQNAEFYLDRGDAHWRWHPEKSNQEQALADCETAINLNTSPQLTGRAWYVKGRIFHSQQKAAEANRCFKEALKLDPSLEERIRPFRS